MSNEICDERHGWIENADCGAGDCRNGAGSEVGDKCMKNNKEYISKNMRIVILMAAIVLLLVVIAHAGVASGPTYVSGIISTNTTWSSIANPYIIKGNILVEPGANLIIEPGVIIKFDGNYYIRVDGSLNAIGTPESRIIFTSNKENPSRRDWKGINFEANKVASPQNNIKYSNIMYAENGIMNDWETKYPINISNNILYTNIIGYRYTGHGGNGDIIINNTFIGNTEGIYIWYSGPAIIHYNIITENDVGITFLEDVAAPDQKALTGLLAELGRNLTKKGEALGKLAPQFNLTIKDSIIQRSRLLDFCDLNGICGANVVIEDSLVQRTNIGIGDL